MLKIPCDFLQSNLVGKFVGFALADLGAGQLRGGDDTDKKYVGWWGRGRVPIIYF